jgi:hypothetical protein
MAIRRLTLVVNRTKPGVDDIVRAVQEAAQKAGVTLTVADGWPISRATLKGADACGVVGGDGTFLGVAEAAALEGVPSSASTAASSASSRPIRAKTSAPRCSPSSPATSASRSAPSWRSASPTAVSPWRSTTSSSRRAMCSAWAASPSSPTDPA